MKVTALITALATLMAALAFDANTALATWPVGFYYIPGGGYSLAGGSYTSTNQYCEPGYYTNLSLDFWNYAYGFQYTAWIDVNTWQIADASNSNTILDFYWSAYQYVWDNDGHRWTQFVGYSTPFESNLYYTPGYAFDYAVSSGKYVTGGAQFSQLDGSCGFLIENNMYGGN